MYSSSMEQVLSAARVVNRVGSSLWHRSFRMRWFSSRSGSDAPFMVISLDNPQTTMEGWL